MTAGAYQTMTIDMTATGANLRALRIHYGQSVRGMANLLLVSEQTVYHWEQGISIPSIDNLVRLARVYSIPLDDLIAVRFSDAA